MTIELMAEVPKFALKPYQKHVLLCLADHASREQSIAWPSQERIAWETGYSRQRVLTILQELENLGIIEAIKHPTKNLPCKTFLLRFDNAPLQRQYQSTYAKRVEEHRLKHQANGVKRCDNTLSKDITMGVKECDNGCQKMLHKPSLEPSLEPLLGKEKTPSPSAGGKASPAEPPAKAKTPQATDPPQNGPTTPGAIEFFAQFKRKRWATTGQQELFESTEAKVGSKAMLVAVNWAATNGIARVPAICTAAKKIAKDMEKHTGPANIGGRISSS